MKFVIEEQSSFGSEYCVCIPKYVFFPFMFYDRVSIMTCQNDDVRPSKESLESDARDKIKEECTIFPKRRSRNATFIHRKIPA